MGFRFGDTGFAFFKELEENFIISGGLQASIKNTTLLIMVDIQLTLKKIAVGCLIPMAERHSQ